MTNQQDGKADFSNDKILLALENGAVVITGSAGESGKGALIRPGKGIELLVNDRPVLDSAEVYPGDEITIKPLEEIHPGRIEVKIANNGLKAEACYYPGKKITYLVPDHPFTDDLKVEGVPQDEPYTAPTRSDLMAELNKAGVVYGIEEGAFFRLLKEKETWIQVAAGVPVVPGSDGRVEPSFEGGVRSVIYDQEETRVDFRKRFEIEQVNSGDVLALIHPPVPGTAGKKVTGEDIQTDPVKAAEVSCESGTEFSADQGKVLATVKGLPTYKKGRTHSFRVDNIYTHKGDVDIKSGNIYFRGHFKLQGAITEGMKVSADGDVEIGDNASGAEILAGGNISFKNNCIKCKVQAGWVNLVMEDIYDKLDSMSESVGRALDASAEVAKALEAKGKHNDKMEAAVIRALLQSKFSELPEYSESLMKHLRDTGRSLPKNLVEGIRDIAPHFIEYQYSQSLGRPVLEKVHETLLQLQKGREARVEKADIIAPYVQNSILLCTGNIIIGGPGVYNSSLKCSGEVRIARLFRGGSIEAGGDVYIGEAGSPRITSEQGTIQVPYKARVHLGTAYENLKVRFGTTEYRCEKTLNNIRLILDQQEFEVKILHWEQ